MSTAVFDRSANVYQPRTLADMLADVWGEPEDMTATDARKLLKWKMPDAEQQRLSRLLRLNAASQLEDGEQEEMDDLVTMVGLMAILQSKARRRLGIKVNLNAHV